MLQRDLAYIMLLLNEAAVGAVAENVRFDYNSLLGKRYVQNYYKCVAQLLNFASQSIQKKILSFR